MNSNTKPHEQYVKELKALNPNVEVIGKYEGANIPLRFRCKICGYEWTTLATNVLRGTGCKACALRKKTKTQEDFVEQVSKIKPSIKVVGKYRNTNTPIACVCQVCGYEWCPQPSVLLRGGGCPQCAGNAPNNRLATRVEFEMRTKDLNNRSD